MTLDELNLKLTTAEEKVEKAKNTLNKYYLKRDKLADNIYDLTNIKITPETIEDIEYNLRRNQYDYYFNSLFRLFSDYRWNEDNIKSNIRKIKELEQIVDNWKLKIEKEQSSQAKLTSIKQSVPEVILEFIHNWRLKVFDWYKIQLNNYIDLKNELRRLYDTYADNRYINKEISDNAYKEYTELKDDIKQFDNLIPRLYIEKDNWENYLNKLLDKEEESKILDLIGRVQGLIGNIIDASNLSIGNQHGELNGKITGELGSCYIETISAGGYNIQKFHYRVLVYKIK